MYAVIQTEHNAARRGISMRRTYDKRTGQIHLEATHR